MEKILLRLKDKLAQLQNINDYDKLVKELVAMTQVSEYRESADRILRNINSFGYGKKKERLALYSKI